MSKKYKFSIHSVLSLSLSLSQALDIKRIEDQRHELEVHSRTNPHQGSLRVSELGLTIIVKFTMN